MTGAVNLPLEHAYVPPETDTDGRPPALVVMHGRGADERDLLPLADHLPDALATVSLRGPDRLMGGYTWYEIDTSAGGLHQSQPESEGFRRSLDVVAESIAAAVDGYDLDPDRLGLLGFSQGATMSVSLLLEDPARYAWIASHHGYLAAAHADVEPEGLDGKPVFLGAGTADQVIPERRARAAANRLRELGCAVTYETYRAGHGVGPDELADLVAFVEARLS